MSRDNQRDTPFCPGHGSFVAFIGIGAFSTSIQSLPIRTNLESRLQDLRTVSTAAPRAIAIADVDARPVPMNSTALSATEPDPVPGWAM